MSDKSYHVFRWWLHIENAESVWNCYVGSYSTLDDALAHFLDGIKGKPREYSGEVLMDDGSRLALTAITDGLNPDGTPRWYVYPEPIRSTATPGAFKAEP